MHGESASADKEETEKFCRKIQEFIKTKEYRPEQVFNCDIHPRRRQYIFYGPLVYLFFLNGTKLFIS
jgi:hypothetical protein